MDYPLLAVFIGFTIFYWGMRGWIDARVRKGIEEYERRKATD